MPHLHPKRHHPAHGFPVCWKNCKSGHPLLSYPEPELPQVNRSVGQPYSLGWHYIDQYRAALNLLMPSEGSPPNSRY